MFKIKTFDTGQKSLYFGLHKTKNYNKIKKDKISNNNKVHYLYLEESNSSKLIEEKKLKEQKKIDGYVFYGNNKIFKTKSCQLSSYNLSEKLKRQTLYYKINNNNKIFRGKESLNKNKIINNSKQNSASKLHKVLTRNKILNNFVKNDKLSQKVSNNLNKSNSNIFPFIKKNSFNRYNNVSDNNQENNLPKKILNLKQLHKNFIGSFKNQKDILNGKDLSSFFNEDKILNKRLSKKNYSFEWRKDNKKYFQINDKQKKSEETININRNNKVIKNSFSIDNNIKKPFEYKINKRHTKNEKILNDTFSKNYSLNIENEKNIPNILNKTNKKNQQNDQKTFQTNDIHIINNPSKENNFSFRSIKNMKISEENSDNNNKILLDNSNSNSMEYKTSSFFFSPKFKKENKDNSSNIKEIINRVIKNNIPVRLGPISSSLFNLGRNYKNFINKRKTQNNFYSFSYYKNWNKEKTKEETNNEENKEIKFNSIKLFLKEPHIWEKHENFWENIKKNIEEKNETFIIPPNNDDILISIYLKLFGKNWNNKEINLNKEENLISIVINDDNIKNPRTEIRKWKKAYKKSILRWHPDKLFPLLTELDIKNKNLINDLRRSSTIIINNINIMYQNIMEILNKILLNKK